MNSTKLLAFESATHLRRLARELNSLPDGFYYASEPANVRCSRARFSKGNLEVIPCGNRGFRALAATTHFHDTYGREVFASRQPVKGGAS